MRFGEILNGNKKEVLMKKSIFLLLVCGLIATGCSSSSPQFKRIDIVGERLDGQQEVINQVVDSATKAELEAKDAFPKTMPIYEISPREIKEADALQLARVLGMSGTVENWNGVSFLETDDAQLKWHTNEISFSQNGIRDLEITKSDEELIAETQKVFESLPIVRDEYECIGVVSQQTVYTIVDGEEVGMVVKKRIGFRRLIDGVRIVGGERIDIYVTEDGVSEIEIMLYEYTKNGEIPMLSLEEAFEKVKAPDAFALETEKTDFSGKAEKLTVERAKLLYVNQFSNGCTILQPVYNLIGTVEIETGTDEFSAKIIAIPEKYTYTE